MSELPNWFLGVGAPEFFERHLSAKKLDEIHCLQIGAYTGDASTWLMENILVHPKSTLTDVDTWAGSNEPAHDALNWNEVEQAYDSKTLAYQETGRIIKKKMTSDEFFASSESKDFYDFIYIDGDHEAVPVLRDGMNAVELLKIGGVLAFDDYFWDLGKGPAFRPRPAIDAVIACYSNRLSVLEIERQVWLVKKA
jgi:predicted O-methyltransferase YrrM